ncbi:hypothetical protein BC829DRAFT_426259 [Chytridium lagenaria]|nr:hypothetical protein BC829DRAFT_426259 [Chytridium lagenaria]
MSTSTVAFGSRITGGWGMLAVPFPTSRPRGSVLQFRGFPLHIPGPTAWYPIWRPFRKSLDDVRRSLEMFVKSGETLEKISPTVFPLERWSGILEKMKDVLFEGAGFSLLRGLDISGLSKKELATIFMGVGSHFGQPVSQNGKGDLLGHVKDLDATSEAQRFHTDSCDIVGLMCLNPAEQGGESFVVSSHTIWNKLMETGREDLAERLTSEEWYWDRKGEVPSGKLPYYTSPVYHLNEDGKVLWTTARHVGVPQLEDIQIEAMDALEALGYNHSYGMELEKGDLQFCHNQHILHARSGFQDSPEADGRYLLRLWLSSTARGWKLPAKYEERYGPIQADGRRGGILVDSSGSIRLDPSWN